MAQATDWIRQQSTPDKASSHQFGTDTTPPQTPPPRENDNSGINDHPTRPRPYPSAHRTHAKYRYDISTLLQLRQTQGAVPVMLRVKPEAIAENIFQYMGAATFRRGPARSRCLSDISNVSRGSISSFNNFGCHPANVPRTQHQNPAAVDLNRLRRADGFVRFLQQHASPPHQRVTAGGRIVPAGPTSPPPMLDYGSLTGLVRERVAAAENAQHEGLSVLSAFKSNHSRSQALAPASPSGYLENQGNAFINNSGGITSLTQPMASHENVGTNYQPTVHPAAQTTAAITPLAVFPDGSMLVFYNGCSYRSYWNGLHPVMEPFSTMLPLIDQADSVTTQAQLPCGVSAHDFLAPSSQTNPTSAPMTDITNGSRASNRRSGELKAIESSTEKETELKSQLTALDKHLALYHFEISPEERSDFVARRRYLVEAIDQIRVSKEKPKRSIPIVRPLTGMAMTPSYEASLERNTSRVSSLKNAISQNHANGKALSPAAVPFVPRRLRSAASEHHTKRTLEGVTNAAIARKDNTLNVFNPSGSTQVSAHREVSSSSVLDPSDPAMRVVDHEDIEYASRYLYNWECNEKRYCTTTAEFQQAIRQVREHARRHGCLGGQSKDPAYDAEQDIWWAICDRDPIPLPPTQPDYEVNPRPWNWEDSVFNYRREGAPPAGRGVDNARNSPRLMGWDPATTERMKDKFDVSRSYFAHKGQLPSVAFRTWAYDGKGNKVPINPTNDYNYGNSAASGTAKSRITDAEANARDAAMAISNALQSPSTRKNSCQQKSPSATIHLLEIRKSVSDGDAASSSILGAPVSKTTATMLDTFESALANFEKSTDRHSKHFGTPRQLHQPYIEDYPETPVKHRSGLGSNGASPFMLTKAKTPTPRSKAMNEQSRSKCDFTSPSHDRASMGDPHQDSAVTRSPWGPEEETRSSERNGLLDHSGEVDLEEQNRKNAKTAKVNIPNNFTKPHTSPHFNRVSDVKEAKSVNTPSTEGSTAHSFLRKMLQGPTYSTAKPPTGMTSGLAERLSRFIRGKADESSHAARHSAEKENSPTNHTTHPVNGRRPGRDGPIGFASALKSDADTAVTKAQSYLVSSSKQDESLPSGHVGDETAYSASPYPQPGNAASYQHSPARIDLPPSTSPSEFIATPTSSALQDYDGIDQLQQSANRRAPVTFGLDGADDSLSPNDHVRAEASKTEGNQQGPGTTREPGSNFDYKGVTEADYEIKREDPNNSWHQGAVDDFFRELAARQRAEVEAERQSSSKDGGK